MNDNNFVEIQGLSFNYKGADNIDVTALSDVTLYVERGEILSIVGPSGCGKTTLLNVIAGILSQTSGSISIGGLDARSAASKGSVSFIFQEPTLLPWRTVKRNIFLPLELRNLPDDEALCDSLLSSVLLEGRANSYPGELSGGMKSRVSLARALVTRPDLLLMDEPLGALDETTARIVSYELLNLWDHYAPTIIMVTHNIQNAVFLSDRIAVLSERPGRVVDVIEVNIPRPRGAHTFDDAAFFRVASAARHSLDANFCA